MLAGCTGYIYWYMRAHWAFVGTGESQYNPGNTKNKLLPRAYVMSHFSKHVTGATRLGTQSSVTATTNGYFENSAYIKGDSLIVMAIDTTKSEIDLKIKLPVKVKSGTCLLSTGNDALCQEQPLDISEPVQEIIVTIPPRSLNTFVFMIDKDDTVIDSPQAVNSKESSFFDLHGRRMEQPKGLCIEKRADGSSRKVYID